MVECMATSDNVVRAGLTRKHRDTHVLCSSLSYKQGKAGIREACCCDKQNTTKNIQSLRCKG